MFIYLPDKYLKGLDFEAFGDNKRKNNSMVTFYIAVLSLWFNHLFPFSTMYELFFYLVGGKFPHEEYFDFLYSGRNININIFIR